MLPSLLQRISKFFLRFASMLFFYCEQKYKRTIFLSFSRYLVFFYIVYLFFIIFYDLFYTCILRRIISFLVFSLSLPFDLILLFYTSLLNRLVDSCNNYSDAQSMCYPLLFIYLLYLWDSFCSFFQFQKKTKISKKKKCTKWDSNPRMRTYNGLNVAPWTTRTSVHIYF